MKFPEYPVVGEPMRASWGRSIVDYLRSITPRPSVDVWPQIGANGTTFRNVGGPGKAGTTVADSWAFEAAMSSASGCAVAAGRIWFSDAVYTIAAATVTLTGATEYVYAYHLKDHSSSGLSHSTSAPLSLGDRWIWPLVYATATAGVWSIETILHRGDIFMFAPLR